MAIVSENLRFALLKENSLGSVNTTPVWTVTALSSESLAPNAEFTVSNMITGGSRGIPDSVLTRAAAGGGVSRELVYEASTDAIFESLLGNTFGNDPQSAGTAAGDLYDYTNIVSLAFEKTWDMGASNNYHRYVGQIGASASINFSLGEIITMETTFVGMDHSTAGSIVAGATYAPPAGNSPMTTSRVSSITLTNVNTITPVVWMNGSCFNELSIEIDNSARAINCIGSVYPNEVSQGRINASATGTLHYTGDEVLDALLAETEYGLLVTSADVQGNSYRFWMPRGKMSAAAVNAQGVSEDVFTNFTFQAMEGADNFTFMVTKTAA